MTILPAVKTLATPQATGRAFGLAWYKPWGVMPTHPQVCVLLGQWGQECRRGDAVYSWNMPNAKALGTYDGDSCYRYCDERLTPEQAQSALSRAQRRTDGPGLDVVVHWDDVDEDGKVRVEFFPSNPATRFRAYATLDEGALAYLDLLFNKFESAWPFVVAGDAYGFGYRLGELGFYTAKKEIYAKGHASLAKEYSRLEIDLSPPPADITGRLAAAQDASLRDLSWSLIEDK